MVIRNLNSLRSIGTPNKTHSVLLVYPDAVLPPSIVF